MEEPLSAPRKPSALSQKRRRQELSEKLSDWKHMPALHWHRCCMKTRVQLPHPKPVPGTEFSASPSAKVWLPLESSSPSSRVHFEYILSLLRPTKGQTHTPGLPSSQIVPLNIALIRTEAD